MPDFKTVNQQHNQTSEQFDAEVNILRAQGYGVVSGGVNPDGTKFVMLDKPDENSLVRQMGSKKDLIREVERRVTTGIAEQIENHSTRNQYE